jgi:hypothetical protein
MIASETGNINFRANLPATLLLKVFSKYDLLVADPKVDTATKLNLVLSFATDKQSRRAGWDKASETEQYLNIQKSMMTSIQMAFSELDQKLKSTGYLTEEARADHENLGTAIEALK